MEKLKTAITIVTEKAKNEKLIIVVSALSKVTDLLQLASQKAASNDESYKEIVTEIEKKHLDTLKDLLLQYYYHVLCEFHILSY